jgi:hypothetical protein
MLMANQTNTQILYHNNGNVCWKNPKSYPSTGGIAYYDNGKICWKDPKQYPSTGGVIYHANGNICWKDPKYYPSTGGIVYHANGNICWKDPKYYNLTGGQCFDYNGKKIEFRGIENSNFLDLGNYTVQIWKSGEFELTVNSGGKNYLLLSTDSKVSLIQNLGSSLYFYFFNIELIKTVWVIENNNKILIGQ